MATSVATAVGFPTSNVPILDDDGEMSIIWYQFFLALWRRTGSAAGTPSGITSILGLTGDVTLSELVQAGLAPSNSPAFTGLPVAPTAAAGTDNSQIATTAFVSAAISGVPVFDLGAEPPISLLAAGSPFDYSPPVNGALIVSGGTVTNISIARGTPDAAAAINSISLSTTSFPPTSPDNPVGSVVAAINVDAVNVGPITLALSGQDAGDFAIVGTDLVTAKSDPAGTYNIAISATAVPDTQTGTFFSTGLHAGEFRLSSHDVIRVIYSSVPSVLVFFPS